MKGCNLQFSYQQQQLSTMTTFEFHQQSLKIEDLNLDGIESEYINVLIDNEEGCDSLGVFPFSPEVIKDFNERIVTLDNYEDQIDIYNYLMICDKGSNELAVKIAGQDKKNRSSKFLKFYNRFVSNKFYNRDELRNAIEKYCINKEECEIKHGFVELWDVSSVTDMRLMFHNSAFNGDISGWNVSNVTDMKFMFYNSKFNGYISAWDVSSVVNMSYMFCDSQFNRDISAWDVSSVTDKSYMFHGSVRYFKMGM
jgi:surface protein